jgi:hypothetical protein
MLFTTGVILFFVGAMIAATFGNRRNDSLADKVGFGMAALGGGMVVGSVTIFLGQTLP